MENNKKVILITEGYTGDVSAVLIVDEDADIDSIKQDIEEFKNENSEWQLSELLESIQEEYSEIKFDAVYV